MARKKRSKKSVAIDTVPLPEFKRGKVTSARGNYYLTIGKKRLEIVVGELISAQDARSLVGKEVYASVSGLNIVAIAPRPRWIICYIPAPDFLRRVRPDVQRSVIEKMASEKIITPDLKADLMRELG